MTDREWSLVVAVINAIGEISKQEAVDALERELLNLAAPAAVAVPTSAKEWRCFQCDEVFTDKAEAHEHFGDYPDDEPLCLIKGADGGLAARIRELEAEVAEAYRQRNEYENDARLWHESEADRVRRIGHVQWWQELDFREGEKLVLREEIARLKLAAATPAAPGEQETK